MKKLMTILPAAMLSLAAAAQSGIKELWHDKSTRGFELTLKGFIAPWGGYHETVEPSRHFKNVGFGAFSPPLYRWLAISNIITLKRKNSRHTYQ